MLVRVLANAPLLRTCLLKISAPLREQNEGLASRGGGGKDRARSRPFPRLCVTPAICFFFTQRGKPRQTGMGTGAIGSERGIEFMHDAGQEKGAPLRQGQDAVLVMVAAPPKELLEIK